MPGTIISYGTEWVTDQDKIDAFEEKLLQEEIALYCSWKHPVTGLDLPVTQDRLQIDGDDDGLTDREEDKNGNNVVDSDETNPYKRDSDGDGLLDGEEVLRLGLCAMTDEGCDPLKVDTDGDGQADGLECGLSLGELTTRQGIGGTKTFTVNGATYSHVITSGLPATIDATGKNTATGGMQLADADPSTWTDPRSGDSDGDGYWDGPTVWFDAGTAGCVLHQGEDANGDGKVDPGETAPDNKPSQPIDGFVWAEDKDGNRIPDEFEDWAAEVADNMNYWYGQDKARVIANVIIDAENAFGEPGRLGTGSVVGPMSVVGGAGTLSYSRVNRASAASRPVRTASGGSGGGSGAMSPGAAGEVSKPNGLYARLKAELRAEFQDLTYAFSDGLTPRGILGRAFTKALLDIKFFRWISDNDLKSQDPRVVGTGGETKTLDVKPNPAVSMYHGTFINGQLQNGNTVTDVTRNLSEAYGIPVMYSLNPTQGTLATDVTQSVATTMYIALPYLLQMFGQKAGAELAYGAYTGYVHREKSVQSLLVEWERIWNLGNNDAEILHFAYSQGNIISRMALQVFRANHLTESYKRMHMIVMGSGYCWLTHRLLPSDTHFTYNTGDPVYQLVGGKYWNPLNYFNRDKWSIIKGYSETDDGMFDIGPHVYLEVVNIPDTYSWWYTYVGGPIFQLSNGSIDAEKWWLNNQQPVEWWDHYNVSVTSTCNTHDDSANHKLLENVVAAYDPSWPFTPKKTDPFNPRKALREHLGQPEP